LDILLLSSPAHTKYSSLIKYTLQVLLHTHIR